VRDGLSLPSFHGSPQFDPIPKHRPISPWLGHELHASLIVTSRLPTDDLSLGRSMSASNRKTGSISYPCQPSVVLLMGASKSSKIFAMRQTPKG
jgi:hypothetical protein